VSVGEEQGESGGGRGGAGHRGASSGMQGKEALRDDACVVGDSVSERGRAGGVAGARGGGGDRGEEDFEGVDDGERQGGEDSVGRV